MQKRLLSSFGGVTRYGWINSDGDLVVETHNNVVHDLIAQNHDERVNAPGNWGDGRKVASLPLDMYWDLKQRGIIDDAKKLKAFLNDPDFKKLRTFEGKV